ncbi:hypothetical protein LINPERHAP1_LOCUS33650, partial [Linum perenne]
AENCTWKFEGNPDQQQEEVDYIGGQNQGNFQNQNNNFRNSNGYQNQNSQWQSRGNWNNNQNQFQGGDQGGYQRNNGNQNQNSQWQNKGGWNNNQNQNQNQNNNGGSSSSAPKTYSDIILDKFMSHTESFIQKLTNHMEEAKLGKNFVEQFLFRMVRRNWRSQW